MFEKPNFENKKEDLEKKERIETFERYMKGLNLNKEDLENKRVIDLGSGDGEFVKELIDREITSEAYGIDLDINEEEIKDKFKDHFIQGDFQKELPIKEADYITSFGAVTSSFYAGQEILDTQTILKNTLNSLKPGGEFRIYPIQKPIEGENIDGLRESYKKWKNLFKKLDKNENISYSLKEIKERKVGDSKDSIVELALIIKKIPKEETA